MFNGFIQAFKDIGGGVPVSEGKPIQSLQDYGIEKAVVLDEQGELTEEGFVSIGRSSFIYSAQKYPHHNVVPHNLPSFHPIPPPGGPGAESRNSNLFSPPPNFARNIYEPVVTLPFPQYREDQINLEPEMIRGLPFVLHPTLRQHHENVRLYRFNQPLNPNMTSFNYDFDFERRVLRDIRQQCGTSKRSGLGMTN